MEGTAGSARNRQPRGAAERLAGGGRCGGAYRCAAGKAVRVRRLPTDDGSLGLARWAFDTALNTKTPDSSEVLISRPFLVAEAGFGPATSGYELRIHPAGGP